MTLYKNKFRIESTRLKNYDYSRDGAYFITICTKNKEHFLGRIRNKKMILNECGKIVEKLWRQIDALHDFIILDEFVIMSNHIHGILFIQSVFVDTPVETRHWSVSTGVGTSLDMATPSDVAMPLDATSKKSQFGKLPKKSISSIINHFKGAAKKWANKNNHEYFSWQAKFHDRIIRNENELNRIRQYIINNPRRWEQDRNNKENVYM